MIEAIKNEYGNQILMKILTNNSTNEIEANFFYSKWKDRSRK